MVGHVSQLIHLVAAFRALRAGELPREFFPTHGEFKFCNSVRFVEFRRGLLGRRREVEVAGTPGAWFDRLVFSGAKSVVARHWETVGSAWPDHTTVGFVGGGGPWAIVTASDSGEETWMARWEATRRQAPDDRIWSVTYGRVDPCDDPPRSGYSLPDAAARLDTALVEIEQFALAHDLEGYAPIFARARVALLRDDPGFPEYVDPSLLRFYPVPSRRLLAGCYEAWVFGGMGSWNDTRFEEPAVESLYQTRTRELYSAINEAIQAATSDAS